MKRTWALSLAVLAIGATSIGAPSSSLVERLKAARGRGPTAASDGRAQTAFSQVSVINASGLEVAWMGSDSFGEGVVGVANVRADLRAGMAVSEEGAGVLLVLNTAATQGFLLDGNLGLISGAADMAEVFPAAASIEPGSVLVIDPVRKGAMAIAQRPYDRRVAGVASGARDFRPGITLGAKGDGSGVKMTLSGTVYCRVTNANGAIRAGDLLTSSALPGHAMRVTDYQAAHGAILGKALEDFDAKSGLALILASLN